MSFAAEIPDHAIRRDVCEEVGLALMRGVEGLMATHELTLEQITAAIGIALCAIFENEPELAKWLAGALTIAHGDKC